MKIKNNKKNNLNINIINFNKYYVLNKNLLLKCLYLVTNKHNIHKAKINIIIMSNNEIKKLNKRFLCKNKPTNIISFKFEKPIGFPKNIIYNFLGDIAIAPKIIEIEAKKQKKKLTHHWQHIVIHGLLHLIGYDHKNNKTAKIMENIEIELLKHLKIPNPYILNI